MNTRERLQAVLNFQSFDRLPVVEWAPWWGLTLDRWHAESMPASVNTNRGGGEHFGLDVWIQDGASLFKNNPPLPLESGGYVTESSFMGTIPQESGSPEEAMLLLGFIASEKGQTALVEENSEWLSVNKAVLSRQKAASPFPEGSVVYEYDARNAILARGNPCRNFSPILPRMETEAAKFYLGLQSIEETQDKMSF